MKNKHMKTKQKDGTPINIVLPFSVHSKLKIKSAETGIRLKHIIIQHLAESVNLKYEVPA